MTRIIKKMRFYYYKNIKKYEYFTITENGKISNYVFTIKKQEGFIMKERVKNIEIFESFFKKNCKTYYGNIEEYLKELDDQHCSTGCEFYELSKFETKSKNPEIINYSLEYDEENDFWYIEF